MVERGAKILVVDGDRSVRTMLELAFSYNGHGSQVFTAPNGRSALLQLGIVRPDLILLDLSLPDGDGWETLKRIREVSTVPVIALAASEDPQVLVSSLAQGADCCLLRPLGLQEVRARVRSLLRRSVKPERFHGRAAGQHRDSALPANALAMRLLLG